MCVTEFLCCIPETIIVNIVNQIYFHLKNGLFFGISLDLIHNPKNVWWSDKLTKYWVKQTGFPTLFSISEVS